MLLVYHHPDPNWGSVYPYWVWNDQTQRGHWSDTTDAPSVEVSTMSITSMQHAGWRFLLAIETDDMDIGL